MENDTIETCSGGAKFNGSQLTPLTELANKKKGGRKHKVVNPYNRPTSKNQFRREIESEPTDLYAEPTNDELLKQNYLADIRAFHYTGILSMTEYSNLIDLAEQGIFPDIQGLPSSEAEPRRDSSIYNHEFPLKGFYGGKPIKIDCFGQVSAEKDDNNNLGVIISSERITKFPGEIHYRVEIVPITEMDLYEKGEIDESKLCTLTGVITLETNIPESADSELVLKSEIRDLRDPDISSAYENIVGNEELTNDLTGTVPANVKRVIAEEHNLLTERRRSEVYGQKEKTRKIIKLAKAVKLRSEQKDTFTIGNQKNPGANTHEDRL